MLFNPDDLENYKFETKKKPPKVKEFMKIGRSLIPGITLRHILRGPEDKIIRIAWSPDGSYLASPSEDKTITIWDASTGKVLSKLEGHEDSIYSVAWSNHLLASSSADHTIRLWNIKENKLISILRGHKLPVFCVAWSPSGQLLASTSSDKTLRIWDSKRELLLHTIGLGFWVNSVAWSPSGEMLAASYSNIVGLWDTKTYKLLHRFDGHSGEVQSVAHSDEVHSVAWSPDGALLLSSSSDKTIRLWSVPERRQIKRFENHTEEVREVIFDPTGQLFVSQSYDQSTKLWRCDSWELIATIAHSTDGVWGGIAFHPNKPVLATRGQSDTAIYVWELNLDKLLTESINRSAKYTAANRSVQYTTAKLVLVGDSGVGKTGLGWRLAHNEFIEHSSTHGQQFWVIPELGLKRKMAPSARPFCGI
jgi:WD40 repeat protein